MYQFRREADGRPVRCSRKTGRIQPPKISKNTARQATILPLCPPCLSLEWFRGLGAMIGWKHERVAEKTALCGRRGCEREGRLIQTGPKGEKKSSALHPHQTWVLRETVPRSQSAPSHIPTQRTPLLPTTRHTTCVVLSFARTYPPE